jgi:hypothetical protein
MKEQIRFRTTQKQKSDAERLAKKTGKELSEYMRSLTDYAIEKKLIFVSKVVAKQETKVE